MNTKKLLFSTLMLMGSGAAFAESGTQSTSQNTMTAERSMKDETLAIQPQLGLLNFKDPTGQYTSRATAGVGVNFNLAPVLASEDQRDWYYGISTGALYSHTGSATSNLFGSGASQASTENSNVILIPANLKIGYQLTSGLRISAHGGGNVIYRSNASSIDLGPGSDSSGSLWKIYPNAGLDGELQLSNSLSLLLKPDMTFTTGRNLFIATVGASLTGF